MTDVQQSYTSLHWISLSKIETFCYTELFINHPLLDLKRLNVNSSLKAIQTSRKVRVLYE